MSKPVRSSSVSKDIVRLEQVSAMMRSANRAFALDDVVTLAVLGFSRQHTEQLKQKCCFCSSSITQNTRLVIRLC